MRVPVFDELLPLYGARINLQPHVLSACLFLVCRVLITNDPQFGLHRTRSALLYCPALLAKPLADSFSHRFHASSIWGEAPWLSLANCRERQMTLEHDVQYLTTRQKKLKVSWHRADPVQTLSVIEVAVRMSSRPLTITLKWRALFRCLGSMSNGPA
jgi:hypothetical protein